MKAKNLTEKDLRADELAFIAHHKISIAEVIDVTGMIPIGQKRAMESATARLAITGRRCTSGHRLKTRSDRCPQCNPKHLAYERRHSETAYVYICASETGLLKIGYAKDIKDREGRLSRESYASCRNWRLIFSMKTEKAGKVEANAHSYLRSFRSAETHIKEGREIDSHEVFRCSKEQAIEAVKLAAESI